jgi:DMSO/TMAO reductase YedYZ molybdopterin-dependent catalytic subunit
MTRAEFRTGTVLAGLLTPPLMAAMYVASTMLRVPFPPFDLFDWLARTLPGPVVTFGIDGLVWTLTTVGLSLRTASKTAEQLLALAIFLAGGMLVGTLLAAWLAPARRPRRDALARSTIVAGGIGFVLAVVLPVSRQLPRVSPSLTGAAWLTAVFAAWGAAFGWAWRRLYGWSSESGARVIAILEPITPRQAANGSELETGGRRRFLIRLGSAAAVLTVAGAGVARALRSGLSERAASAAAVLPSRRGAIGPASGTRPEITPVADHYRIDVDLLPPSIDGTSWALPITGLLQKAASLTLEGFERGAYGPARDMFITLSCISNPVGGDLIGTSRWTGVSLRTVLEPLGVGPSARYVTIRSSDGFHETVPLDLVMRDERIMLTYHWDGQRLPAAHGFPLRLYIPDRYGMKQPKWIVAIQVLDRYEAGYWVVRGWDETAQVKATSVIDTVAVDDVYEKNGRRLVPIGGIAYAGARGISRVQVRVDAGPWTDALIGEPLSELTWVIWRYDWPYASGPHTFAVRSVDGAGQPQPEEDRPSHPSGATGIDRVTRRL